MNKFSIFTKVNKKQFSVLVLILIFVVLPVDALGQGLIPCNGNAADPCEFHDVMALINNIVNFILVSISVPIAAIMFAYAGFLMVISGGSSEAKTKAKGVFTTTVIGLLFVAGAWLIVHVILSILGYNGAWIGF